MPPPVTQSGKIVLDSLTGLSRELKFYAEGFKATRKLKATIAEIDQIKRGVSTATQSTKELEKQFKTAKSTVDNIKKGLTGFFKKVPGNDIASKGTAAGGNIGGLLLQGGLAVAVIQNTLIQNYINDVADRRTDKLDSELTKVNGRALQAIAQNRTISKQINDFRLSEQRTRDRIYTTEKEIGGLRQQLVPIRDKANDALYEVRQGRKILEGQIVDARNLSSDARKLGNDALAEIRGTKQKIEISLNAQAASVSKQISDINARFANFAKGAGDNFQQTINTTINGLKGEISALKNSASNQPKIDVNGIIASAKASAQQEIANLRGQLSQAQNAISGLAGKIAGLDVQVGVVGNVAKGAVQASDSAGQVANAALKEARTNKFPDLLPSLNSEINKKFDEFVRQNNADLKIKDLSQSELSKKFDQEFKDFQRQAGLTADQRFSEFIKSNNEALKIRDLSTSNLSKELDRKIGDFNRDISDLKGKTREQDIVNAEGNRKLDELLPKINSILPTIAGIPLIAGRVIEGIKPNLLTAPQVEQATQTGMCKSLQNGCGRSALDNAVGDVNKTAGQNKNKILDAIDVAANATNLTMIPIINNKLGDQLPGGIGGKLSRIGEWLHLDRVLNIMIAGTTIHNALMLSNDLGQTLVGIINNVLQLFGLKKEDGSAFDIGSVISSTIENLIKSTIGADNYVQLRSAWAKANRIYQASVNILNAFQGLANSILTGLEMTAGKVAKIGNALRKSGEVLESAYGWMNPQPKFNRITQTLESLQNGASTIQMVTQAPLDIINAATELTTATTELTNAVKQDENAANKGKEAPEPEQLKATESASKLVSAALELADIDLDPDD